MGNCVTPTGDKNSTKSEMSTVTKEKKGKKVKLLLLGAGEAGKSTIAKQMKITQLKGFTPAEIAAYKAQVHGNVLTNIRLLIKGAEQLGIQLDDPSTAARLANPDTMSDGVLSQELAGDVKRLWTNDRGIKAAFARGTEFHLVESAQYYFENLDRISNPNYKPSDEDVLRARRLTVGAEEIKFQLDGYLFHVIDVGGQKGEREKWIEYFQGNDAVIFFVALSEYDQKLAEDNTTSRILESQKLFSDVCNHQWFADASIILFLNKSDIFREKIKGVPLTVAFPEYKGRNEFEPASEYIRAKFIDRVQNKKKAIYPFITCATNTENFKNVFSAVKDVVISRQIHEIGI